MMMMMGGAMWMGGWLGDRRTERFLPPPPPLDQVHHVGGALPEAELVRGAPEREGVGTTVDGEVGTRLRMLRERVEAALERGQQMEL